MSTKAVLISNPNAGRGGVTRRLSEETSFCETLRQCGLQVEVQHTAGPDDAARLAAEAARAGVSEIIVSGGDGTINEALQGLVGTDVRIGIWARGTANVLAHVLGLPFDAGDAAQVIARGRTRRIHVGSATSEASNDARYFLLMAGVGLDASVVQKVRARLKRRIGEAAFWYSGLEHLLRWRPTAFEVEIGAETYAATFAAIGKAPRYGGNLAVTPRASLDEPQFEVCLINSHSKLNYLRLLAGARRPQGVAVNAPNVLFHTTASVRVHSNDDNAVPVQVDGELIGTLPMRFEIAPHTVEVVVP